MTSLTIIPSHDQIDIETKGDLVAITQVTDVDSISVCFHKRYIDEVINALVEVRGPSEQEMMEAEMRAVMAARRNEVSA